MKTAASDRQTAEAHKLGLRRVRDRLMGEIAELNGQTHPGSDLWILLRAFDANVREARQLEREWPSEARP